MQAHKVWLRTWRASVLSFLSTPFSTRPVADITLIVSSSTPTTTTFITSSMAKFARYRTTEDRRWGRPRRPQRPCGRRQRRQQVLEARHDPVARIKHPVVTLVSQTLFWAKLCCKYLLVHTNTQLNVYVCVYVCMYACMYVCMPVCVYIYIHLYMYIYISIWLYVICRMQNDDSFGLCRVCCSLHWTMLKACSEETDARTTHWKRCWVCYWPE